MNSQGGLTEAQLEDLGTKGKAGLGEALGPLVLSLANEYKEVNQIGCRTIAIES